MRFATMESCDKVLAEHFFFDNKPLILKPWEPNMDIVKEDIRVVPVWIQLKLNLKYWGKKALFKIVEKIGKLCRGMRLLKSVIRFSLLEC